MVSCYCSETDAEFVTNSYDFISCAASPQIGSGAYGCVASFEEAGENGSSRVAVKKIGDLFRDLVDAKRILREIKILKALKHENLIELIEILDPLTPGASFLTPFLFTEGLSKAAAAVVCSC